MANKRKIGNRRHAFKARKFVGKSKPQTPEEPRPSTSSRSKEKLGHNFSLYDNKNESLEYEIVDVSILKNILSEVAVCRLCHCTLSLTKKSAVGLATEFSITCLSCDHNLKVMNCSKITRSIPDENGSTEQNYYDLNLRLVYSMRVLGKGYTSARTFCGMMNLPPPPTKYKKFEDFLRVTVQTVCNDSMKSAVEEAVTVNQNNRDLCVALDGSWQKRGHVSLNGIVSLTSADTAKVLDIYVMSKYCHCPNKQVHLDSCLANYSGTSGGMEVYGAVQLFQRSLPRYNIRYLEYLGDGDTNAYKSVCDAQPYGPNVEISKIECVGHVQKRMGSRLMTLRNTLKTPLADGKKLTGKNRLTEVAVKKFQIFYGLAIRRNQNDLHGMRQAVWAIYFHVFSNNENPCHQLCPKDENTWCKFNLAQQNKQTYDHREHFHLPSVIMQELRPIFSALSDHALLKKCLKGKTQNPNESLNNVIWCRVPKRTFVSLDTLNFGVFDAVLSYNDGYLSKIKVLEHMGLAAGINMVNAMKRLDWERVYKAEKAVQDLEKKIRQARVLAKRKLEDLYAEAEDPDNPSYSAGHY